MGRYEFALAGGCIEETAVVPRQMLLGEGDSLSESGLRRCCAVVVELLLHRVASCVARE